MKTTQKTILKAVEDRAAKGNAWINGFYCTVKPGETREQYRARRIQEEEEYLSNLEESKLKNLSYC